MERLTKKDRYGHYYTNEDIHDRMLGGEPYPHAYDGKPIDKLADYEDKQEQGALVELKAKVGDDIFKIINGTISLLKITRIEITIYGIEYFVWGYTLTNEGCGVTWFLTEAEAEEALAKMGGSHE